MKRPFASRRRLETELAYVKADRERIRAERTQFAKDRDAYRAAAETAARQFTTADRDLAAARRQLDERGQLLAKVPDALVDHDARRKALTDALGLPQAADWSDVTVQASALRTLLSRARSDVAALTAELAELRDDGRHVDGGTVQPRTVSAEVLRERARADALAARLAEVTAANQACTCGGAS